MEAPNTSWRSAESGADLAAEVRSLRRTLRDVVALSALPSIWVDCDLPRSIQNLTDVLRAALRAVTVCVRVELPDGSEFNTAASNGLSNAGAHLCDATELLDSINWTSSELIEIPRFNGSGPIHALPHPVFLDGRQVGCFVVCYKTDVLPAESDRLLLQVASDQLVLLFQRHRDQEEKFARRLAEDRLRQAEHRYQQLVRSLPAAVYTTDNQGCITLYNEAAVKLWGRRPKIGQELWCGSWKIFRPDGSPMPLEECPMAVAIREERSVRGQEIIVERPDGSRAWVLPHPDPIRDESGKIVGFVNMLVQIDELKRAEQAARANEARIQSLLTLMPAAVYACDAEGRFTFYNCRAVELWGWEPKLNDDQQKFCAMHKCWFNGKQIPPEETPMAVAVREGKGFRNLEPTIERPDGTQLSVLVNIDPVFDAEGKPAGAINVFQDVTPLKRVQDELKSREEHLRAIVENTPECVKLVAEDGTLLAMNGAGLCMVEADSAEHVIGKNVYDVIAPEYRSSFRAMNERVCAGNKERLEFEIVGLKGTRRWMETHAAPIVDPATGRTVQIAVSRNITERRNGELELRRKNKQLAAFLETAALGLHRVGPDGIIQWANDAELEMLGYTKEEYIGRDIREFHADEPVIDDILKRLTCGEKLNGYEARLRCKDGTIKDVLIDSSVLWEDGKFVHTQCFTRDVTERKNAERALRESQAQLQIELADSKLLQAISGEIVSESNMDALYEKLVHAAAAIMRSDFASMQMYCPERGRGELRLLGLRGFGPEAAKTWEWVSRESPSSCGEAMRRGERVVGTDVERCDFLGIDGLAAYRAAGIGSMQSTPLFSRNGELVGMLSTHWRKPHEPTERELRLFDILARLAADAIERRRAEQALRETNERLKKVLEIQTVGVMFWDLTSGRLVDANDTFLKMMGYSRMDVESQHLTWEKFTPPEYHEISREEIAKFMAVGRVGPYEKEYFHKDGTRRWLLFAGSSLGNNQCVEFCVDVSERKKVEHALRESEERYRATFENAAVGIAHVGLDGQWLRFNDAVCAITGYAREELERMTFPDITHPEDLDRDVAEARRLVAGEIGRYAIEKRYIRKDGSPVWTMLTVSLMRDAGGQPLHFVSVIENIDEKKRAGEILEQTVTERTASLRAALEQMEEFSYSVSHDLRSPLRAISAYAMVLKEEYGTGLDETARGYLEKIERCSNRMDRLTQDVLTYSRLARSEMKLEPIAFERLVKDIINQYATLQAPAAKIEVCGPFGDVLGNETTLGQCVANLLNNAVKFVAPGVKPCVVVRSEARGKQLRVWFEDNGIGIKREHQERIFQMFERVHPEAKYEGTGIGLTIVRKALEKMGGKVGVESDGVNGSRFWIELQRA